MAFLDWTLILDYLVALAIVATPVELWIGAQIHKFRRQTLDYLESPDKRAELIHELSKQLWEPFAQPEQRAALINEVAAELWKPLSTTEDRQKMISELGHGLVRVLKENEGSLKGIATRQIKSELLDTLKSGSGGAGALAAIGGKVDLPIVGKVSIPELLQIVSAGRQLLNQGVAGGKIIDVGSSSGSASSLP